ncbi:MAG: tRNA uridine-5-carboxymethylaminomethyl(34) synthesis GTPase MnmE [Candidatus Aminicenantales bacterium]
MDVARLQETIIAVSTPPGPGGLGIVRLSGRNSLAVANKIFEPGKECSSLPAKTAVLGHVLDRGSGQVLDEAFLIYFPGPRSYTREDIVEISCHGSPAVLEEAVRLGVRAGARLAQPGEFTLRAYVHGRIDILQAEAVQSLINSVSLDQARIAFGQVQGELSHSIARLRSLIIGLMARLEARIEFSEDGQPVPDQEIREILQSAREQVRELIDSYEISRIMREGIRVVIAGRPNVGKSTLFNALLGKDRAIVTPYAGTTRDFIAETVQFQGKSFNLIDMAGLGQPRDSIEEESVRRGKALADEAEGVLHLLDASQNAAEEDLELAAKFSSKRLIVIFNKADLPIKIDKERVLARTPRAEHLEVSALKGLNLDKLKDLMAKVFAPPQKIPETILLHLRQKLLLEEIGLDLKAATAKLMENYSEEIVAEEVLKTFALIGQLTGEITSDMVLETVFSNFCIGK